MLAGREELDETIFLLDDLVFLRRPRDATAAASAGLMILYHADLLVVGGVGSGLM